MVDAIPTQVHGVVMATEGFPVNQLEHISPPDELCTSTGDPRETRLMNKRSSHRKSRFPRDEAALTAPLSAMEHQLALVSHHPAASHRTRPALCF